MQLAALTVQVADKKIIIYITIANPSGDHVLYLEKSKVVASPPNRTKLFRITCDGKEIPYIGPLAKRKPPTQHDFFTVAPGAEVKGSADITGLYAFLPGTHTYTIQYKTFQGDPGSGSSLNEIDSGPATFVLHR